MRPSENILGIGNDIIEISRIKKSLDEHQDHFLNRLFSEKEQAYCEKFHEQEKSYAGRFAAKEAIAKAFGEGIGKTISWLDIEILHDEKGRPVAILSKKIKEKFNNPTVHLTISHCREYASAVAIWTGTLK